MMMKMCFIKLGTGKTKVIVAAIEEIVRNKATENFVLVCASSNAACDEIFERLMEVFLPSDIQFN